MQEANQDVAAGSLLSGLGPKNAGAVVTLCAIENFAEVLEAWGKSVLELSEE